MSVESSGLVDPIFNFVPHDISDLDGTQTPLALLADYGLRATGTRIGFFMPESLLSNSWTRPLLRIRLMASSFLLLIFSTVYNSYSKINTQCVFLLCCSLNLLVSCVVLRIACWCAARWCHSSIYTSNLRVVTCNRQ